MHTNSLENKISAQPDNLRRYLQKVWKYRNLIVVFATRDLKTKYAQTFLGLAWSLINPITATIIFSFFFGYVLRWEIDSLPFPVYVLSGLIAWNFFTYIVTAGTQSIQESSQLIKKIYFPKTILPFSKVLVALVELGANFGILIALIVYYNQTLSVNILLLPFAIVFNALCALSIVFWVGAFAYKKRDLLHILPFLTYFGIWITPVFFSPNVLPSTVKSYLQINPMTSVVELWRYLLFNYGNFNPMWLVSFMIMLLICIAGMYFYSVKEHKFSDFS